MSCLTTLDFIPFARFFYLLLNNFMLYILLLDPTNFIIRMPSVSSLNFPIIFLFDLSTAKLLFI